MSSNDQSSPIASMSLESMSITDNQKAKLKELFPEVFTEGSKIDFDKLKRTLGETVDSGKERFGMNWAGKADCFKTIQQPSVATLVPARDESVDFDSTENVFIEGDNLEVLKLLQKSYLGKIKMIYIDPPYNTGSDFIYPDNYSENLDTYLEYTGQIDSEGRKFSTNVDTDGRFHSKWMNMMYPRLFLAKNLLKNDGVMFISIDDNEISNVLSLIDEIFGEANRKVIAVKMSEPSGLKMGAAKKYGVIPKLKEYVIVIKMDGVSGLKIKPIPKESWDTEYNIFLENFTESDKILIDEIQSKELISDADILSLDKMIEKVKLQSVSEVIKNLKIKDDEKDKWLFDNAYRICQCATSSSVLKLAEEKIKNNGSDIFFVKNRGNDLLYFVRGNYNKESKKPRVQLIFAIDNLSTHPCDLWVDIKTTGLEAEGSVEFKNGKKPLKLLSRLIDMSTKDDDFVLDFFAGSGSTAEAIFKANIDGSKRKFILVQLPEQLSFDNKEQKSTFQFCIENNIKPIISEITKERIRRAAIKVKAEIDASSVESLTENNLDLGFRVYKLQQSNFKIWDSTLTQDPQVIQLALDSHIDHINPNATQEDILFELLLKAGFQLTTPIEKLTLVGKTVFSIADNALLICLEKELTLDVMRAIAEREPARVIVLDEGFQNNDQLKTNAALTMKSKGVLDFRTV